VNNQHLLSTLEWFQGQGRESDLTDQAASLEELLWHGRPFDVHIAGDSQLPMRSATAKIGDPSRIEPTGKFATPAEYSASLRAVSLNKYAGLS
jgi:hypothetical protein